jgi:hypothetical protein
VRHLTYAVAESHAVGSEGEEPVVNVRCLECGQPYVKPVHGSISVTNPGCPRCSYVGWVPVTESEQGRSAADRQLRPLR